MFTHLDCVGVIEVLIICYVKAIRSSVPCDGKKVVEVHGRVLGKAYARCHCHTSRESFEEWTDGRLLWSVYQISLAVINYDVVLNNY